jgi:hypothetical protein
MSSVIEEVLIATSGTSREARTLAIISKIELTYLVGTKSTKILP